MPGPVTPKTLIVYVDEYGNEPYVNWIDNLKDKKWRESAFNHGCDGLKRDYMAIANPLAKGSLS